MRRNIRAFSLVEVALALGVAGFCILALTGLLPIAVKTNQNSMSQTAATTIVSSVISDLRSTPKTLATSPQYAITFGTAKTLYFDSAGACSKDLNGTKHADGSAWGTPLVTRYQLDIDFPNGASAYPATYAHLTMRWPPNVAKGNTVQPPAGSVEAFAAFDRH